MQYIASGLGDHVYDGRSRASDLGGKTVGGNLEFLYSIFRDIDEHSAYDIVVVVHTVDAHIAAASQLARGGNDDSTRLGGIEIGSDRIARNE